MTRLALLLLTSNEVFAAWGLWAFLAIGAVSLFGIFLPAMSWIEARRKEREAYYRSETIRRIAESSGEGAKAAMDMLREDARLRRIRMIEGMKIGGIFNLFLGVGLVIFMVVLLHGVHGPALVGLLPGFVGLGMLIYVLFLAKPVE